MNMKQIAAQRTLALVAGVCLAANTLSAATPLLNFGFDEGSGTNVTDSANQLLGQLGRYVDPAAPLSSPDNPAGSASDRSVSFNFGTPATDAFLVAEDTTKALAGTVTNAFTIEAWVKLDPADTRTFEGIGGYGNSYKLGLNAMQIQFTLFGIVDINSGLYVPADGSWHHIAVAWQPGVGATFFLDGGIETSIPETRGMRAFANDYLVIGAESVTGNALQGMVDRFRIHEAVLTADLLDSVAATPKGSLGSTVVNFGFAESAPPFSNYGSATLQANVSYPYVVAQSKPLFTTNTPSGKPGDYALTFKAADTLVVPDPTTLVALDPADPSFTIQAWLKPGVLPNPEKSVVFLNDGPGGALAFSVSTDRHLFVTTLGVLDIKSTKAILPDDGGWHHAAVVHENGKEMRFYVDGALADTVPYTGGVVFTHTTASCMFGSENGYNHYVGSLDRFKMSKGLLTLAQLDSWPVPGVQPGSPELTIEKSILLSWPTIPGGYSLQTSTDLGDVKNWTTVTNVPLVDSRGFFLVFPTSSQKVFYRLFKP